MDQRQAPTQSTNPKSRVTRFCLRFGRICIYSILGLTLTILLLFSVATFYLYQNPMAISNSLAAEIKERTGIETSFAAVDVTLLPLPALALSDITMQYDQLKLEVAYATVGPALLSLLKGDFALGHATLVRPKVSGTLKKIEKVEDKPSTKNAEQANNNTNLTEQNNLLSFLRNNSLEIPIPDVLYGCDLNVLYGSVDLRHGETQFFVDNFQADINISLLGNANVEISLGSSSILGKDQVYASMDALQLNVDGLSASDSIENLSINLNTRIHIDKFLESTVIDLNLATNSKLELAHDGGVLPFFSEQLDGSLSLSGKLLWEGSPINFAINGGIAGDFENTLKLNQLSVNLEQDHLILQADINNIFDKPSITGEIDLGRLSLTQWFGFARNLPPGLQASLHTITKGHLKFSIDENSLKVPYIEASAADADFKGHGGVSSWKDVVVHLDLTAPFVSLVKAFPETEGFEVETPSFAHEPLTPIPGSPEAENMPGPSIDYDINLRVKELTTWGLSVGGVDFRVVPPEMVKNSNPKKHPSAVLLDFNIGKFYTGNGKARLILFRTDAGRSGYDITALLRNVKAEGPLTILAGREILGGRLSLDTSVLSYGKNLGEFLINKDGELSLRVDKGFFTSKDKERTTFTQFNAAGKFKSAPLTQKMVRNMPEILRYNGLWRADLQRPDLNIESKLTGIMTLIGRNYTDMVLETVPTQAQINLTKELTGFYKDTLIDINGKLSLNSQKNTFGFLEAQGNIPDWANSTFGGSLGLNFAKNIIWDAQFNAKTKNFSTLLAKMSADNTSPIPTTAPQEFEIQSNIHSSNDTLNFSKLRMSLDDMRATGNVTKTKTKKNPLWEVDLSFNLVDFDRIFPDEDAKQTNALQTKKAGAASIVQSHANNKQVAKPWSLDWLRNNDAKGTVNIDVFRIYDTTSTKVRVPIAMNNASLKLTPITGNFSGGPAQVDFTGKALGDTLSVQGGVHASGVNMLQLSNELKLDTAIGGSGSVWLSLQGALNNSKTILPLLDGTWRVKLENGFFQNRKKDGMLDGSPTVIKELQDAGPLSNGILYSKNLVMKGPELSLTGSGNINMVQNTLDMHLIVTSGSFKKIPVHYYGSLDDPKRDIATGHVIVGAISSLGTGFFDIIGGALKGLFSLFQ